jgi:branched-chain amino acid transport system ATP-binding protein
VSGPLLQIRNLTKRFGGLAVTKIKSLDVRSGEIHALIGPNGAGKTTLICQIMGELQPDGGSMVFDGVDLLPLSAPSRTRLGLGRTFQITQLLSEDTALQNVAMAVQAGQGHSFRFWRDAGKDASLIGPAREALDAVGLLPRAAVRVAELAHGECKQLELAVALALKPRLLVLDEPMAGLGPAESEAMTRILAGLKSQVAMLLVEHDMEAVFALADRITVLVYGSVIASGAPEDIRQDPQVLAAYLSEELA